MSDTHVAGVAHPGSRTVQRNGASQAKAADAHICPQGLPEHQGGGADDERREQGHGRLAARGRSSAFGHGHLPHHGALYRGIARRAPARAHGADVPPPPLLPSDFELLRPRRAAAGSRTRRRRVAA